MGYCCLLMQSTLAMSEFFRATQLFSPRSLFDRSRDFRDVLFSMTAQMAAPSLSPMCMWLRLRLRRVPPLRASAIHED